MVNYLPNGIYWYYSSYHLMGYLLMGHIYSTVLPIGHIIISPLPIGHISTIEVNSSQLSISLYLTI